MSQFASIIDGRPRYSNDKDPLITIITVVLNGADYLEKSIESVINQTYKNVEYIIIDGGSTDGTLDIIKKYVNHIDYWVSEPDNGIYDAMNKGIKLASGKWLFFLGSDDRLRFFDTLENIKKYLKEDLYLIFGEIGFVNKKNTVKSKLNFKTLLHNTIHHQSAFYNIKLFTDWKYDSSFNLIADYELNLKIYLNKLKYLYIEEVISLCNDGGMSRKMLKIANRETNLIRRKYLNAYVNFFLSIIYNLKFYIKNV